MLSALYASLFGPAPPRCPGTGSKLLLARRAATDAKYTARPLDHFPNPLVSLEELARVRAEAGVLDETFTRYKREAKCQEVPGPGTRGKRCEGCRGWCCNVSYYWFGLDFVFWRVGVEMSEGMGASKSSNPFVLSS
jgi:hypothetical protein